LGLSAVPSRLVERRIRPEADIKLLADSHADAVKSGIESHGLAGFCRVAGEAEFGL